MPARFCPQCGHEQSSAAKFCSHCGASLTPGAAAPPPTRVDAAARRTRRLLAPLTVAALIVLTAAVALLAYKLAHPPAAPPLTNAPPPALAAAPPLTNAPTAPPTPAPPLTSAPTVGPGQLPPDVAAYLKFLKGIEDRRVALDNTDYSAINEAITQAVNTQNAQNAQKVADEENDGASSPSPQNSSNSGSQINQPLGDYEMKWQALISDFRSQSPPEACSLLAKNYYLFISDDSTGVDKLHVGILNKLDSSNRANDSSGPGDLASDLLKTHAKQDQEGAAADDALTQLCARYNAPKPFSIKPEGASSSLLGQ